MDNTYNSLFYNLIDSSSNFEYDWPHENGKYLLSFDVPGFSKEEVSVKTKQGRLIIKALPSKENKRNPKSIVFILPKDCDLAKTYAELENGVLNVSLPEKESSENKEISIKIT